MVVSVRMLLHEAGMAVRADIDASDMDVRAGKSVPVQLGRAVTSFGKSAIEMEVRLVMCVQCNVPRVPPLMVIDERLVIFETSGTVLRVTMRDITFAASGDDDTTVMLERDVIDKEYPRALCGS
jgi:hypothetical protein